MAKRKNKLYADYDFEEAYQDQIANLEEWEERQRIRGRPPGSPVGYQTKTTKAGGQLEVDIYPAFSSKHDLPRAKRKNASRPAQKNLNDRRARRYLNNLVSANFGRGDLWCTFTYDEAHLPGSREEAEKILTNFLRRINRRRKKLGLGKLKYVSVTEYSDEPGKKIRVHHHVIMSGDMSRDEIEDLWKHGKRNQTRRIDPDEDTHIAGMVNYITKDPHGRKRWRSSRNLTKPKVTKSLSKFRRRTAERMAVDRVFLEEKIRKAYPGYKFVDAEVRVNDINSGFYIYARMRRD